MQQENAAEQEVRYEPDDHLRPTLALGLAVQHAALSLASIIVTVLIVVRSAGLEDSLPVIYLTLPLFHPFECTPALQGIIRLCNLHEEPTDGIVVGDDVRQRPGHSPQSRPVA